MTTQNGPTSQQQAILVIEPATSATKITHTKGLYHNGILELSA